MKKEPSRLLALSDGLFATVLTLLVLDLRMPAAATGTSQTFQDFARWLGPHLFSYILTFLVAGTYWLSHHRYFDQVARYDNGLLRYNLLFLLFIGLFPFTTALISSFGGIKSGDFPLYWAIYAGNVLAAGVMMTLIWNYAVTHGLTTGEISRRESRHNSVRMIVIPLVFLVSIAAEFLFPQIYLGPYILMTIPMILWIIDRRYDPRDARKAEPGSSRREFLWRAGSVVPWLLVFGLALWCANL